MSEQREPYQVYHPHIAFSIPGLPPSGNHLYATVGNRRMLSRVGREWHQTVADACVGARLTGLPWPAKTRLLCVLEFVGLTYIRDVDNAIKATIDGVAAALEFDDRYIDMLSANRLPALVPGRQETRVRLAAVEVPTPVIHQRGGENR